MQIQGAQLMEPTQIQNPMEPGSKSDKGVAPTPQFREIIPDSSRLSEDLREVQKTVQNYGNSLYGVPQAIEKISLIQIEIKDILKEVREMVFKLGQPISIKKKKNLSTDESTYSSVDEFKKDPKNETFLKVLRGGSSK